MPDCPDPDHAVLTIRSRASLPGAQSGVDPFGIATDIATRRYRPDAPHLLVRPGAKIIQTASGACDQIEPSRAHWPDSVEVAFLQDQSEQVKTLLGNLEANVIAPRDRDDDRDGPRAWPALRYFDRPQPEHHFPRNHLRRTFDPMVGRTVRGHRR